MSLRELFIQFYEIHPEEKITIDKRTGFLSDGLFYFTTNVENVETIHMEQAVLAHYLFENGYKQIALPIKNQQEEWFTDFGEHRYLMYEVTEPYSVRESPGKSLARFHQVGSAYQFEPKTISSYGHWKRLWVEKLTFFEERILKYMQEDTHPESEVLFQAFPYIIGMSENAIQYLRETETEESRYFESDQGTIAFLRFDDMSMQEAIWSDQLVYDHPVRDIAEYIRKLFLDGSSDRMLHEFLNDYQMLRPLSIFSWRLLYARLLFPIHLFDAMEQCLQNHSNVERYKVLNQLLERQSDYEKRLTNFYDRLGVDKETYGLVEVDWL